MLMSKGKQKKPQVLFQMLSTANKIKKEASPHSNEIKENKRSLSKNKKQDIFKQAETRESTIMRLIKDEMWFSQQQHQDYIQKANRSTLREMIIAKSKMKWKKRLFYQQIDNEESATVYNKPLFQVGKGYQMISSSKKDIKNKPKSEFRIFNIKKRDSCPKFPYDFNTKTTSSKQQLIFKLRLRNKAMSLPKLPVKLPFSLQKRNLEFDNAFAPWQSKDSRQQLVRIK